MIERQDLDPTMVMVNYLRTSATTRLKEAREDLEKLDGLLDGRDATHKGMRFKIDVVYADSTSEVHVGGRKYKVSGDLGFRRHGARLADVELGPEV